MTSPRARSVHERHQAAAAALAAVLLSCAGVTPQARVEPLPAALPVRTGVSPSENPFVHAVGTGLVDGAGRPVLLKGIAFSNRGWDVGAPLPEGLRSEADYRAIREIGVNSVRFYLNYRWFEDDRTPYVYDERGFAWLAQNVAWARAHGILLLLNMHTPQGGFQSNGGGREVWNDPENQRRFVALWREIARRFKDEPAVLGYDLLNEPVVAESISQWEELARAAVAAIRQEDPRHLVVIERVNAVYPGGWFRRFRLEDWNPDRNGELNFFVVNDTNVMYEFHFYQPVQFTHQGAPWLGALTRSSASYPGTFPDWDRSSRRFDRGYVEAMLQKALAFGERHRAPLYLGEFGVIRAAFGEGRNGAAWVSDVIDVALEHGIGVTYHSYDDEWFGLSGPQGVNPVLAELLAAKYR